MNLRFARAVETITCPMCCVTSYNENDVREKYCGVCKAFHADMPKCPCGAVLHYERVGIRKCVEELIAREGPTAMLHDDDGRWFHVPRHYLALHGAQRSEFSKLGFQEVV